MPRRTYCAFNATYLSIDRMSHVFNEKNTTWRWHTSDAHTMRYLPLQCRPFPFQRDLLFLFSPPCLHSSIAFDLFVCSVLTAMSEKRKYKNRRGSVVRTQSTSWTLPVIILFTVNIPIAWKTTEFGVEWLRAARTSQACPMPRSIGGQ